MSPQKASLVCLGVISASRGLKGEVRIKSFTEDPNAICDYGPLSDKSGERLFDFDIIGFARGQLIARIKGIHDRSAADALKGTELYIERSALPKPEADEFYHLDLIGLKVTLKDGDTIGTVKNVEDFGAGTLLEVETALERDDLDAVIMVPFTREAVPEVNLEAGFVIIDPLPGLLERAKKEDTEDGAEDGGEGKKQG